MRERFARWATGITAAMVVVLVIVFASLQNPAQDARAQAPDAEAPDTAASDTARVEAGRQLYNAQECSMCHSIDGTGNPRYPLDGVGARHDADAMRALIVATGTAADALPARARHVKADYRDLPDEHLDALVAYMQSLR